MSITCVVQIFYNWESFSVRISCFCKKLSCFLTVRFVICICWFIVISTFFTEVSAISVRDTRWYITASFNLSRLSYFINNVSTINSKCECFTNFRIVKWSFLCLEAYIICSKVVYDLHIAGSDQVRKFCLRSLLDVIKLAGFETGKHSVGIIHQFECDGIRSKICIIIVVLVFSHYDLRVVCPLCQFVWTIGDVCRRIKCPLITFFFNDILTYWHCSWECTDFFEIWNICSNSNFKCLIINCFCSKFRSIFLSCNDFICIYNAVKHVAVVSCCSWVNKTFPSVFKISCCNIFSV